MNVTRASIGAVVGLAGLALLAYVDWRIAVAVFLCIYGNNIEQSS